MFDYSNSWNVVKNLEDQYSIWPSDKLTPPGWHKVKTDCTKEECLLYIKTVWTDMRPRSLQNEMDL